MSADLKQAVRSVATEEKIELEAQTDSHSEEQGLRLDVLPVTDLDSGVVGWDSQVDPAMPFNFPKLHKWAWVWLLSIITLLTPFATSILSPAIDTLDSDLGNDSASLGSMTVSIFLFGYVVGPIFIGPLSEVYGRKPVLTLSCAFFCLWQIGCGLAPNIEILIVSRFFSGVGGAAPLTLGGSIIGDLFRPHERGFAMGMWNLGPLFGPVVGPLFGGFVTQDIGWRWDFWIVLAASGPVTVLIASITKETSHKTLIQKKTVHLRKQLGREDLKSCFHTVDLEEYNSGHMLFLSLQRPLKLLLFSPIVLALSAYIAFLFGTIYLLYTTIPDVFQRKYGFSTGQTGFPYIALAIGNGLGWLCFTALSDRIVKRLARANQGVFTPEMRLAVSIPFGVLLPMTLFWYGWSSFYTLHWASTIISLVPFGFGLNGLFLPISTYIVDSNPMYAASATAANVIVRSIVGATLPLAGPPMYESLGLGWGNSLLGFVALSMVPLPLVFYKYGARMRETRRSDM